MEEDLQYHVAEDGSGLEVHHFRGGAFVHRDGKVESACNTKLAAVLNRKISEARLRERPAQFDEKGQAIIKFSALYEKQPDIAVATKLLAVFKVREEELTTPFLVYDTKFLGEDEYFPLEHSEYKLLLLLLTEEQPRPVLWTTVRPWNPGKEEHYRGRVGEYVTIQTGRQKR